MNEQIISGNLQVGERLAIRNQMSIPVKFIISGFGCGAQIEIGVAAGDFFTLVKGTSELTVAMRDIDLVDS